MKKLTAISICIMIILTAVSINISAADKPWELQSVGQIHFDIYKTDTPPVIDGKVSEEEYGYTLYEYSYGSPGVYWQLDGKGDGERYGEAALPAWTKLYMTYDTTWVYVGLETNDKSHISYDNWDGDYLEFDISLNFGDEYTDMSDRSRIALGINGEDGKESEFEEYFYLAAESSSAQGSSNYEYKVVRDKANSLTTYEFKMDWKTFFGSNGPVPKMYFYAQLGIGDLNIPSLEYKAYIAVFRLAADVRDPGASTSEFYGRQCILHVANFVDAYPPVEEVEEVATAGEAGELNTADTGSAAAPVTSGVPQTGDATALIAFVAIISLAGCVLIKKKVR